MIATNVDNGAGDMATSSVGMAVALAALAMTFGALLLAYAIVRAQAPDWPPVGETAPPGVWPWPLLATLAAIGGSVAMRAATRRATAERSQARPFKRALLTTAVAGAAFLGVQVTSWWRLLAAGVRPSDGLVASVVYALTSFHALHALAALVVLAPVLLRTMRGGSVRPSTLAAVASFWHLVTVVWIVVFVAVFIV